MLQAEVHQLNQTVKDLSKQLKEAQQQTRLPREAHLAQVLKNSQNSLPTFSGNAGDDLQRVRA
jgi:hypothetical protein